MSAPPSGSPSYEAKREDNPSRIVGIFRTGRAGGGFFFSFFLARWKKMEKDPLPLLLFSRRDGIGLFKGALSIPTSNRLVSPLGKGRDYKAESIVAIKHCFAVVVGGEGEKRGEGWDSSVLHLISPSVSKIQRPGMGIFSLGKFLETS